MRPTRSPVSPLRVTSEGASSTVSGAGAAKQVLLQSLVSGVSCPLCTNRRRKLTLTGSRVCTAAAEPAASAPWPGEGRDEGPTLRLMSGVATVSRSLPTRQRRWGDFHSRLGRRQSPSSRLIERRLCGLRDPRFPPYRGRRKAHPRPSRRPERPKQVLLQSLVSGVSCPFCGRTVDESAPSRTAIDSTNDFVRALLLYR